MNNVTAALSMLHEPADLNSATRLFRGEPVLNWTLERLSRSSRLGSIAVLCWEDQASDVSVVAADAHAHVLVKGPRNTINSIEAVAAAQKFADGWRGGLQSSCEFDRGFYGPWLCEIAKHLESDAMLLIDPASGLVDFEIIDAMIEHAIEQPEGEIFFTQAAPGLAGVLLRPSLLERLAKANIHPGRLLHYMPEQPVRDPIGAEGCVAIPTPVARTTQRFKLDSQRQIDRITEASINLNGTLVKSCAEALINRLDLNGSADILPRDLTIELTVRRETKPKYAPASTLAVSRPDFSLDAAVSLFKELSAFDDIRITFAGTGDPLLHPEFFGIIAAAREAGIHAIHLETDLLAAKGDVEKLVDCGVDVVSVSLPAMHPATYAKVMGVDRMTDAIANIKQFVTHRQIRRRGVPLLVPTFVKLSENLAEMEVWYDQWLRAVGSAVIVGPSDFAGQIPNIEVADMRPPKRCACRRLDSRLTILSDGSIVACEQNVLGTDVLGKAGVDSIREVWQIRMMPLREAHAIGEWKKHSLCGGCKEWHRP